jgi:Fe(3+) dicitrate transport protein
MIFTEAVPTGGSTIVNRDLEEGSSVQYEAGIRGQPAPFITWDTSLFLLEFDDQIGSVAVAGGTSLENVGRAVHWGWEATLETELLGLAERLNGGTGEPGEHQLRLHGNVMLLNAEFVSGPQDGHTPQYAPNYLVRAGGIYQWRERAKVALLGTFVDDHYADDANSANFLVPGYMVWDLTAEVKVYRHHLSILAGVNNLFGEDYYARIRGDGIDPAYGRNFYAGLALAF